ncbi:Homeobox-3 [Dorcoceras hygrometricum]|uniref:Homeobox-3 n=1 Tax=Dorcoceras hygrometricum TaxID=472368 RepID=A0A2Z7D1S3_9LAMI|nr:Homeobox-3 [Dorcoceras hygrometricum]
MVNPPRDEIRKIRVQLQEYGHVGDANVFYWFQNRKSRSKHKQRQQQNISKSKQQNAPSPTTSPNVASQIPISSSSYSDKSAPNDSAEKALSVCSSTVNIDMINSSPTASVNQSFLPTSNEFLAEPFFFPVHPNSAGGPSAASAAALASGFFSSDISRDHHGSSFPVSELMLMNNDYLKKAEEINLQQLLCDSAAKAPVNAGDAIFTPSLAVPFPNHVNLHEGDREMGPTKSTVFINDVCFEVGSDPFNVRQAFGDDAVLLQSSGQPVLTNEWGITLQPLSHGHFYYLLRLIW